ncbi:MAG: carboxypeptidase-like regulatory domain-containing protein, partial [Blastocatellia bacterium]
MRSVSITSSLSAALLILLSAGLSKAQTSSATLQGAVTDPQGQVIPGAKVSVQSPATGLQRQAVTNEAGLYVVNFLPVGGYNVTVEARSFKQARLENITLEIGQTRALDVALEIGTVEQTVTIVDSQPPLDRNSATIG